MRPIFRWHHQCWEGVLPSLRGIREGILQVLYSPQGDDIFPASPNWIGLSLVSAAFPLNADTESRIEASLSLFFLTMWFSVFSVRFRV